MRSTGKPESAKGMQQSVCALAASQRRAFRGGEAAGAIIFSLLSLSLSCLLRSMEEHNGREVVAGGTKSRCAGFVEGRLLELSFFPFCLSLCLVSSGQWRSTTDGRSWLEEQNQGFRGGEAAGAIIFSLVSLSLSCLLRSMEEEHNGQDVVAGGTKPRVLWREGRWSYHFFPSVSLSLSLVPSGQWRRSTTDGRSWLEFRGGEAAGAFTVFSLSFLSRSWRRSRRMARHGTARHGTARLKEKLGMAPTATNPSTPSLYRFGPNRHQPALNASTRIRTPDRRFTIGCPAGSFARAAEIPEAESTNVRYDPSFDGKPVLAVGTEARLRADGREEGESDGGESEESESREGREEVDGRGEQTRRETRAREVEGGGWKRGGRGGFEGTEEEKKAVAVIAGVLKKKFGPQIVREEGEEGFTDEMITDEEEAKGRHEEEEEGYGDEETECSEGEEVEDGEGKEGEEAEGEAEAEASEGDGPPTTSPLTTPPPLYSRRAVFPSSLLSLYRFFSSHLGISSPSTVASLLATHPALLRSDPASDLLPRVHLLQSYGVSRADISAITMRKASWLRNSLPQVREMLDFFLARGMHRTKLGSVLRRSAYLIRTQVRSTNLDILVERAGVPVDKLGVIIEKAPDILFLREETMRSRLEQVSAYFLKGYERGIVSSGHLRQHLNWQDQDKTHLRKLLVQYPAILLKSSERIRDILSLLQSFTPPDSPSIAARILRQAPSLVHFSSQNVLAKLQFLVELVGKKAAARVVRSHQMVLLLSVENMQEKVVLLSDLIGRGNAVLAVARSPLLLASNGENIKKGFRELVREVEEALEESGGEEIGRQMLEEGARKRVREVEVAWEGGEGDGYARESPTFETSQVDARERAEQGGSDAGCQAGSKACAGEEAEDQGPGPGPGSKSVAGTTAHEVVVNLVVKFPTFISYSWGKNMRLKVDYLKRDMGLSIKEVLVFPFFLGYSLDRRIRPRHVALVSQGYVLVPHEVALPVKRGEREWHFERVGSAEEKELEDGEDEGEKDECGLGKHEYGSAMNSTQDSYAALGRKGAVGQRGVIWQQGRKAVCLVQFLTGSDKQFKKRFNVKLAPFMP
ncbi:unnamed protein product [Closterium sp. Yama58-4]|nr:unnamed protein product [Closterium sp. Yama58-4]